jgi:predicted transcriptional regulator
MTHNRAMLTRDKLSQLLQAVSVEEVAREAGVSTKTVYRLRHQTNSPTLDTAARLIDAIKRIKSRKRGA